MEKHLLGINDNERIYLSPPSWDCGWYWGFGYLGNKNCHYHLSGLMEEKNLHDGLIEHFGNTLQIQPSKIWVFCELVKTAYTLKETAEVLGRGGSHYTKNPCKELIKNQLEVDRINKTVLPAIFEEIENILSNFKDFKKQLTKIQDLLIDGDTTKVITLMFKHDIKPDDLEPFISSLDFSVVHAAYFKEYYKNR